MSEKILSTMNDAMRTDNKITDRYYIIQWSSKPYTLQKDKLTKCYTYLIIDYAAEIVCDAVLLNYAHNEN